MSELFTGFVGPSYQLQNRYAAVERTVNWYLTANEAASEETKFRLALEPSPGNQQFSTLPVPAPFNQPNRGMLENRGRAYGVNGNVAFSIDASGNFTNLGVLADDGRPCSMVANGNGQIFIASAGNGYVIPAAGGAGSLVQVGGGFLGAAYATFQDGYILVVTPGTNQFQISGDDDTPLGDATKWTAANVSLQAGQADYLRAMVSSREYLRLLGERRSQIYQNVGNSGIGAFPFQSYNETFIETGIAAPFSLADLGDSLMWVGQGARGQCACWRDAAFQPQRVSTFAIEQAWQGYANVSDAVAFPYVWNGHLIYRITFPSALLSVQKTKIPATWEYDATVSALLGRPIWCERQYHTAGDTLQGRPELFHCYAYGEHLVGSGGADGNPGAIYRMSAAPWSDCGTALDGSQVQQQIVRDRICPHQWRGNKRRIYDRIEFELARGIGLDGAPPVGVNPQMFLRWSNDGGNSWGPEQNLSVGRIGDYGRRVFYHRCGYARDRVFHVRCTDSVGWSLVNAMLDVRELGS